jgi:hypothetical protein
MESGSTTVTGREIAAALTTITGGIVIATGIFGIEIGTTIGSTTETGTTTGTDPPVVERIHCIGTAILRH